MTLFGFPVLLAIAVVGNVAFWVRWARYLADQRDVARECYATARKDLAAARETALRIARERTLLGDALAAIVDAGDWGGDLATIRDNAKAALVTGGHYGRLSAALDAAEQMAAELDAAKRSAAAVQAGGS